jgi:hypothetical protein
MPPNLRGTKRIFRGKRGWPGELIRAMSFIFVCPGVSTFGGTYSAEKVGCSDEKTTGKASPE